MFSPRSSRAYSTPCRRQRGVAIITALLIVTIATTVSITISTRLQLDVRRTGNLIAQDQAQFYLLAAEEWSQRILRQDKQDSTSDSLDEAWAIELPPIPVDGGSIQGRLTDLHACLNINSLVEGNAIDVTTKQRLSQLFAGLGVKGDPSQAIADWIDSDLETTNPNGAEDSYYLNLETPYRTANTPLHSVSELRLVKGFEDSENYRLVEPYLCAFIVNTGNVSINVNTASAEVLQSLSADMTDSLVDNIIERRNEQPFSDLKEFTNFENLGKIIENTDKLSTSSEYFLLRTQAIIGQANKVMYSVIYRDENGET
ncbi:MAG: type II secretion system minor pseudopilin GspK, partial [Gammaproteobacteria bacterium]|nr:type II secretion system minor pseudopilin GspK [Gammaproteobacteria bacterium]NNJ50948.1 type II secretion system minor pseudopilin GspK [Gammaproteobacteria bacterium]